MPDEIDLLRLFRGDTPGPDDAAWERARAAVTVAEATVRETTAAAAGRGTRRNGTGRRGAPDRVARSPGTASASPPRVTLAAGIAAGIVSRPAAGAAERWAGRWSRRGSRPGRCPPPRPACGCRPATGGWSATWSPRAGRRARPGPSPARLPARRATTCYVEGDNASSPSGPANMNTLYVSGRRRADLERAAGAGRRHVHLAARLRDAGRLRGGRPVLRQPAGLPVHDDRRSLVDRGTAAGGRRPGHRAHLRHRERAAGASPRPRRRCSTPAIPMCGGASSSSPPPTAAGTSPSRRSRQAPRC